VRNRKSVAAWWWQTLLAGLVVVAGVVTPPAGAPADAQTSATDIGAELVDDGAYLESESADSLDSALEELHRAGAVFVEVAASQDAEGLAGQVIGSLPGGTSCDTVLVLTRSGIGARSTSRSDSAIEAALAASVGSFASGATEQGLVAFADALGRGPESCLAAGSGTARGGDDGGGLPMGTVLVVIVVLGGLGWAGSKWWKKRQATESSEQEAAQLRAEVQQTLAVNADRVIELADHLTLTDDDSLVAQYEEASHTYREVSMALDSVHSVPELQKLKDRIEAADRQLTSLEAHFDGI